EVDSDEEEDEDRRRLAGGDAFFDDEDEFDDDDDDDDDEALEEALRWGVDEDVMDQDEDRPVHLDSERFMKAVLRVLGGFAGVDESIMKPKTTTTTTNPTTPPPPSTHPNPKHKNKMTTAPPPTFDPTSLLTPSIRAVTQSARLGVESESDSEDGEETSVEGMERRRMERAWRDRRRGVGGGVQEVEMDSEEEGEVVGRFDRDVLRRMEGEEK
ncbi:hypothetical protein HDU67_005640, partial [Dinochytrium kinnereticum]